MVLNGPYGPYVKKDKTNARIPKGTDPETLTEEQCLELIKNAPAKKRFGKGRKKSTRKSTSKKTSKKK